MIRAYHQPRSLDEALAVIAAGSTPIAGATALYVGKGRRDLDLCDITSAGLSGVTVEKDRILIGATTTLSALVAADLPGVPGAFLPHVAAQIASRPLRNAITVGGNIAQSCFWADLPIAFLALDAEVEIQIQGQPARWIPAVQAMGQGCGRPWEGGLITRVAVPRKEGPRGFGFLRFTKTANDYSLATAGVTLARDGAVVRDLHILVGAVQARPQRLGEAEALLEGKPASDETIAAVAARAGETMSVGPNFRAPADYRRKLATALVRRALIAALEATP